MQRDQLENLLRDRLRERADDVEPTPALWLEVDRRRQARERWRLWRVWSGSLAAAAAVLAAVVVVPMVLDSDEPEIAPVEPVPEPVEVSASAPSEQLPDHLVLARDDEIVVLEVATGRERVLPAPGGEVHDVAARPGSVPGDDLEVAYTAAAPDAEGSRVGVIGENGDHEVVTELPPSQVVDPTVVWSPDGEWIAWSRSDGESFVGLSRIAGPVGDNPAGAPMHRSVPEHPREREPLRAGLLLNDWIHEGISGLHLAGTHVDRHYVQVGTDLEGPVPGLTSPMPGPSGMEARASAAPDRSSAVGGYSISDHGEGLRLRFTTPHDSYVLPMPEGIAEGPYVLDAMLAGVTVSDGERAWLVTHDGQGADATVADLGAVSAVSIVRDPERIEMDRGPESEGTDPEEGRAGGDGQAVRAGGDGQAVRAGGDGQAGRAEDPEALPTLESRSFDELAAGVALETEGAELRLRDQEEARTLHTLEQDGARWLGLGVRPGSTSDRITAVGVAAEDPQEAPTLHRIEIVEGELDTLEPLDEAAHRPAPGWSDVAETRPVWSPDGDMLAWAERESRTLVLRTIAWEQDGPGEHTRLEQELPEPVEGVVGTQDWVATSEEDTTLLRLVHATGPPGSMEVAVERQGEEISLAGQPRVLEDEGDTVRAVSVAGSVIERGEQLRWRSASTEASEQRLPTDVLPGEYPSVSLGPTASGAAPLHSGGDWWLITPDAVAPWPEEVDEVALVPGA